MRRNIIKPIGIIAFVIILMSIISIAIENGNGTGKVNGKIVNIDQYMKTFKSLHNGTPSPAEIQKANDLNIISTGQTRMYVSPMEYVVCPNCYDIHNYETYYMPILVNVWNATGPVKNAKVAFTITETDAYNPSNYVVYPTQYRYTDSAGNVRYTFVVSYILNSQYVGAANIYEYIQLYDNTGKWQYYSQELDYVPTDD